MASTEKIAVVTGGSAGVGRSAAQELARAGYDVAVLARGVERLEDTRKELEALGRRALALEVDVANASEVEAAAARIEADLGPIDVWVNNAMASMFSPFEQMTEAEFERVTAVTYLGVVNGTRSALRRMRPRNRGAIVQVGSALAYRSIPLQSAYCGAKAAIRGFTDSLRSELRHEKSRVHLTMVQLPALNTPQFGWVRSTLPRKGQPVPPIFQPEVAGRAIAWAARKKRREVYVGWPALKAIVFGAKLAPGIGDRYLARTGYEAQQTNELRGIEQRDNLFAPVPGHHGSHGTFDAQARSRSLQMTASMHPLAFGLGVLGVGALAAIGLRALQAPR